MFFMPRRILFLGDLLKTVKKIDPMSAARMAAIAGIIWGILVGVLSFMEVGVQDYMGRFYMGYHRFLPMTGIVEVIILPVAYGMTGFIVAYIGALIYNYVAKKFGGIKIDMK